MSSAPRTPELHRKLATVRAAIATEGLGGVRLRGTDCFSWATCGGSNVVLLTSEVGVAEVWVTEAGAWVLTDVIEAERLIAEELPEGLELWAGPWERPEERERFVEATRGAGPIASDRPRAAERPLPGELLALRGVLEPEELDRYRALGRDAAEVMTEVLLLARPDWTGLQLAGAGAEALWGRGIHPALTLVGDERRLPRYRHPIACAQALGSRAMLVFCARRHGLFANLTRFVYFRAPTQGERRLAFDVAQVEAAAFDTSRPGATLGQVFDAVVMRYAELGYPGAERLHHQGGSCGYLSRDEVARPGSTTALRAGNAVAWNPSLPGAKIEDTAVVGAGGLELLTVDPRWPTTVLEGRSRPELLVR